MNTLKMTLKTYYEQGMTPARISIEFKNMYRMYTEAGEIMGEVSGKFRYLAKSSSDYPAVGDWVAIEEIINGEKAIIHDILPRKTKFSRKMAGNETQEQIVVTNFDYLFIVSSLNRDYNIRRIERYLVMAWESEAVPVIILSKADICANISEK